MSINNPFNRRHLHFLSPDLIKTIKILIAFEDFKIPLRVRNFLQAKWNHKYFTTHKAIDIKDGADEGDAGAAPYSMRECSEYLSHNSKWRGLEVSSG